MIAAAEGRFALDIPDKEGNVQREILEEQLRRIEQRLMMGVSRQQDRDRKADLEELLSPPPAPFALAYLLEWFTDLNADRQSNGFGPQSISSGMILDWAKGRRIALRTSEFEALRALNRVWMKVYSELHQSISEGERAS